MRLRHALAAVLACALIGAPAAAAKDRHDHGRHHRGGTVDVQVVGINDFHGNLEPPGGSGSSDGAAGGGGIEYLATHVKALEARNPRRTVVVSAGDLIGASPLLSALFHDEPTIEAMNAARPRRQLGRQPRVRRGRRRAPAHAERRLPPDDRCPDCDLRRRRFRFLAANVVRESNGPHAVPALRIKRFGGVKVAFIGDDARGHAADRHARPASPACSSATRPTRSTRSSPGCAARACGRSSCSSTRAASDRSRRRLRRQRPDLRHRRAHEPRGRPLHDRPHAPDLQLRGRRHARSPARASFGKLLTDVDMTIDRGSGQPKTIRADNLDRHARRGQGPGADRADRQVPGARRRRSATA